MSPAEALFVQLLEHVRLGDRLRQFPGRRAGGNGILTLLVLQGGRL